MPNQQTDALFLLIKSLEPFEKRHFKMYLKKITHAENLKMIQLFTAIEKQTIYNEIEILRKNNSIQKKQLSNLKAHLYQTILISLRLIKLKNNIDLQLHELLDFAKIVYNKGLYNQSIKILQKIKDIANENNQLTYLTQALFLEKKIEALHVTRSLQQRADELCKESNNVINHIHKTTILSNYSLQLYSWYIKNGHARNKSDVQFIEKFFKEEIKPFSQICSHFYEKNYLYQCYCWYSFILQDFLQFYKYSKKWVLLFEENNALIEIETTLYIKAIHNLLTAMFTNKMYFQYIEIIEKFEKFNASKLVTENKNNQVQTFVYLHLAKINLFFLEGNFKQGTLLIPFIESKLKEYEIFLDKHRILIFYYKFASLYFGSGNYNLCIDYLNKIINWNMNLRTDIQCYARFLLMIAHYELKNEYIIKSLTKSVYRFLLKMENLNEVEKEIFTFIQKTFNLKDPNLKKQFTILYKQLKKIEKQKVNNRAFMYLDILSWLESKISNITIEEIYVKRLGELKAG